MVDDFCLFKEDERDPDFFKVSLPPCPPPDLSSTSSSYHCGKYFVGTFFTTRPQRSSPAPIAMQVKFCVIESGAVFMNLPPTATMAH